MNENQTEHQDTPNVFGKKSEVQIRVHELKNLLSRLIGEHKELLELTRAERLFLTQANVSKIDEVTCQKELLLHQVKNTEQERIEKIQSIAQMLHINDANLKLSTLVDHMYKVDLQLADQLRASANTLQVIIKRIQEQNELNGQFVLQTLAHLDQMKANIIQGLQPNATTYSAKGKKTQSSSMNMPVISTEV